MVRTRVKGMHRDCLQKGIWTYSNQWGLLMRWKLTINWRGCTEMSIRPLNASTHLLQFTRGKRRPIYCWITKIKPQISLESRLRKPVHFGIGKIQSLKQKTHSSAYLPLQTVWISATEASGCWLPPANYSAGLATGPPPTWQCEGRQLRDTFTSSTPKMTHSRPPPLHSHHLIADRHARRDTGGAVCPPRAVAHFCSSGLSSR